MVTAHGYSATFTAPLKRTCVESLPYAHNWGGDHIGDGKTGSGLGTLVGNVIPYILQNTLISYGIRVDSSWGGTCLWHNVTFEAANADYTVADVPFSVDLDAASYNSWLAATDAASRGAWRLGEGGPMRLTDAPAPQILTEDTPTLVLPRWVGDEAVVTGAVKRIYRAFGGSTNGWELVWP